MNKTMQKGFICKNDDFLLFNVKSDLGEDPLL